MHTIKHLLISACLFFCCQLSAQEVSMYLTDTTVVSGAPFCRAVRAVDFDSITNFQFTLRWNPQIIRLDSITGVEFPPSTTLFTNLGPAPTGLVPIIWLDPMGDGVDMPDSSVLFLACFTAIATPNASSPIEISDNPVNIEISDVEAEGEDIGLGITNGTVNIVAPHDLPQTEITNVNCYNPTGGAIGINPIGAKGPYTYQWTGPNNFTATTEDLNSLGEGTYQLIILDSSEPPLRDTFEFEVGSDFNAPTADAGEARDTLDCNTSMTELSGIRSSMGLNILYEWSSPTGMIVSGGDSFSPTVNGGGTYRLVVTDQLNGCTAESFVVVEADTVAPMIAARASQSLNCLLSAISLDGTGSATGSQYSYEWQTTDGNIVDGEDSLNPTVDKGGTYLLRVTDGENGCSSETELLIVADTVPPMADPGLQSVIDCANPVLELGGVNTSTGPDFRFEWTTMDGTILEGETQAKARVNRAGTYTLMVVNQANGCSASASIEVRLDDEVPVADAGQDTSLTCYASSILIGGSGSTSGLDIVYEWQTNDGNILSGETSRQAMVDQKGIYRLIIRDTVNSCESFSEVTVGENFPEEAEAGADQSVCDAEAILEANMPAGMSGVWSSLSTAIVESPSEAGSEVTNLDGGHNLLVWTLSTPRCPDYSRDTVLINRETAPVLQDDFILVPFGVGTAELNLTANDGLQTQSDFDIRLLDQVPSGTTTNGAVKGSFTWNFPTNYTGMGNLEYEVCNAICPSYCDTAIVFYEIEQNLDTTVLVANGITPNGDGVNDVFVIDELLRNPQKYPNNELVVFNRWGDVVYNVIPYLNDWDGRNMSGADLQEGTYYYILKLNLSEGGVIKGDLTILR